MKTRKELLNRERLITLRSLVWKLGWEQCRRHRINQLSNEKSCESVLVAPIYSTGHHLLLEEAHRRPREYGVSLSNTDSSKVTIIQPYQDLLDTSPSTQCQRRPLEALELVRRQILV